MLSKTLESDFFGGRRSAALKYCINDPVQVISGIHQGRMGAVVALDRTHQQAFYLVEFGEGTDELFPQMLLTHAEVPSSNAFEPPAVEDS